MASGRYGEWYAFVGAMKIARTLPVFERYVEWYAPHPGSLSEGAGSPQGLTEGVSFDGCSVPTIYTPAHINSEIFEFLRSSGYTPSVSHSLDSSLREGAGNGRVPFNVPLRGRNVAGDFHRPYERLCHSSPLVRRAGSIIILSKNTPPQSDWLTGPFLGGRDYHMEGIYVRRNENHTGIRR